MKLYKFISLFFITSFLSFCTINPIDSVDENGSIVDSSDDNLYKSVTTKGIKLEWKILQSFIEFKVTAPTNGWIGVGFEEVNGTGDYDVIIGRVLFQGVAEIIDCYGSFENGYVEDTELGGMDNIVDSRGVINQNQTTIVFTRLLNTGDSFDITLTPLSQYNVYLVYSNSEDFNTRHSTISKVTITL